MESQKTQNIQTPGADLEVDDTAGWETWFGSLRYGRASQATDRIAKA